MLSRPGRPSTRRSRRHCPRTRSAGCGSPAPGTGVIQYWIKLATGSWEVMITADELPVGPPWQGRYIYDPATIRARDGDVLPTY